MPILTLCPSRGYFFLKIHILCDLHVEFGDFVPPVVGADIVVLAGDVHVEIGGYRFFGCTLWSDMELFDDQHASSIAAADAMNDYRLIRHSKTYRRLSPKDTRMYHFRSLRKLTEFLKAGEPERSIVVTHHAPSIRSIADRYKSDPVSAAVASNMDDFILEHQPRLWIHGHTHESFDYEIGKTRVVCNPRGYTSIEESKGFKPDYILVV